MRSAVLRLLQEAPLLATMQAAAARLREAQLAIVQERVERQVSQLATLQEDRQAEVQSGHNSGLIRDKCVEWSSCWGAGCSGVERRGGVKRGLGMSIKAGECMFLMPNAISLF